MDVSSDDEIEDKAPNLNFKWDQEKKNSEIKRRKVEHQIKIEHVAKPLHMFIGAATYNFGELTRQENPLRNLTVPIELLREFQDFEIRMGEMMERLNSSHKADYDRCMFCWLIVRV